MIESKNNDRIKKIAKLKGKKYQKLENKFLIEGEHLVEEAYKTGYLEEVFALEGTDFSYPNISFVSKDVMRKLSNLANIPKIIGVARKINNGTLKGKVLLLDDIKNPGNMGTILRSASAFDVDTIVISKESVDLYNDKVVRASEGLIFSLNIIVEDLHIILEELKKLSYTVYTTDVDGGEILGTFAFEKKSAIIMGSEASGVNKNIKEYANKFLYIKMKDTCESLNVGVSASIIMYELSK